MSDELFHTTLAIVLITLYATILFALVNWLDTNKTKKLMTSSSHI